LGYAGKLAWKYQIENSEPFKKGPKCKHGMQTSNFWEISILSAVRNWTMVDLDGNQRKSFSTVLWASCVWHFLNK
jgi:hypothetical protein